MASARQRRGAAQALDGTPEDLEEVARQEQRQRIREELRSGQRQRLFPELDRRT